MPCFYTPELLMKKTINYNEILYKNEVYDDEKKVYVKKPLHLSYIVCYDRIYVGDLSAAQIHDVPIILIHTDYYKTKNGDIRLISDDDKAFLDRKNAPFNSFDNEKILSLKQIK